MFRLLISLSALILAVAGSPIANSLDRRVACAVPASTVTEIAGTTATLTGPFKVTASVTSPTAAPENGAYLLARASTYYNAVFNGKPYDALKFYINQTDASLVSIDVNNTVSTAYYAHHGENPEIQILSTPDTNAKVQCSINGNTCALNCVVNGHHNNFLSSPSFQPDWTITTAVRKNGQPWPYIPFQPYIVPVPAPS